MDAELLYRVYGESGTLLYAILSDVHANVDALEAVLKHVDLLGIEKIVCLGDVVGYNAEPNECVAMIAERNIQTVLGNHDAVACGIEEPWGFNPTALKAAIWTREKVNEETVEWLRSLPDALNYGVFTAVHGAPKSHNIYLFNWEDALPHLDFMDEQNCSICFIGHTHTPAILSEDDRYDYDFQEPVVLEAEKKYFINPGSIGQPRDNNPDASFGVFDTDTLTFQLVRTPYDVELASKRVRAANLPDILAERLHRGR